jgi:hypothetical protein
MTAIVNAGLAVRVTLKSPNAVVGITTSAAGNVATVTVQIDPAGVYLLRAWLADNADGSSPTLEQPSVTRDVQWWPVTTAAGTWTCTIEHAAARTWYLAVVVLGIVSTTDSLEFT